MREKIDLCIILWHNPLFSMEKNIRKALRNTLDSVINADTTFTRVAK